MGYLDETGRLWFCGRKSQVVWTEAGPLFTERIEPIFNQHPNVFRSALVGCGPPGRQLRVIIVEPEQGFSPESTEDISVLLKEMHAIAAKHTETKSIEHFLLHPSLPVDVRHNVKINREALAVWAAKQLAGRTKNDE